MFIFSMILWIVLAIGAGAVANAKGRSGGGYFLLALFLPLIGFLIAIGIPSLMYVDANGVQRRMVRERDTAPEPAGERVLRLVVVYGMGLAIIAAAIIIATRAFACSPAPTCWFKYGPDYLRGICTGYARSHLTRAQIAAQLDEPDQIETFVRACSKLNIRFTEK